MQMNSPAYSYTVHGVTSFTVSRTTLREDQVEGRRMRGVLSDAARSPPTWSLNREIPEIANGIALDLSKSPSVAKRYLRTKLNSSEPERCIYAYETCGANLKFSFQDHACIFDASFGSLSRLTLLLQFNVESKPVHATDTIHFSGAGIQSIEFMGAAHYVDDKGKCSNTLGPHDELQVETAGSD
ncbi:hypothetical protein C8R42DRAFT_643889 [Lentinula raphanica]|nr:hypothetical protein C8R42DRAFT_643889 [Lentinula raphanica]